MSSSVPVSRAGFRRSRTIKVALEKAILIFFLLFCSFMHVFHVLCVFFYFEPLNKLQLCNSKEWVFQPTYHIIDKKMIFLQSDAIPDIFSILQFYSIFQFSFTWLLSIFSSAEHPDRQFIHSLVSCIWNAAFRWHILYAPFFYFNELYETAISCVKTRKG